MWEIQAGEDQPDTPESICARLAQMFRVKPSEVALLEVSGSLLKFLYPPELKQTGAIPLSSSAIAARTARKKRADVFNNFTRVKHSSVFEVVKLADAKNEVDVIQKLMTAPVTASDDQVVGVIQVSRKAKYLPEAGPDFTPEDLKKLEAIATSIGKLMKKNSGRTGSCL